MRTLRQEVGAESMASQADESHGVYRIEVVGSTDEVSSVMSLSVDESRSGSVHW